MFSCTPCRFELSDILSYISEGMELIVQDDFSKCFRENPAEPWNWNAYLFPLWCIGVIVRYAILLPIRFISLLAGFILFAFGFVAIKLVFVKNIKLRQALEVSGKSNFSLVNKSISQLINHL